MLKKLLVCGLGIALGGCFQPMKPSPGHLSNQPQPPSASIPPTVQALPAPPKPRPTPKPELYSVVVNQVNVRELLFALARDAKVNVDIHPGITGTVTLNAIDQTLPQLLNRISKQVDMRYELDGPNLVVAPDSPYLRIYKIDYVNMQRTTSGQVSVAGNIAGGSPAGGGAAGGGGAGGANTSTVSVRNEQSNKFWETLVNNVKDLLRETDKVLPGAAPGAGVPGAAPPPPQAPAAGAAPGNGGAQAAAAANVTFREAAAVIANPETGILTIRATARQHEKIQEFLDYVLVNARRQVLIEATVVEVQLSNTYQQGIDWQVFLSGTAGISGGMIPSGTAFGAGLAGTPTGSLLTLRYNSNTFTASVRLLEQFGTVKVVSSPRISVINNQTAILKVVDNLVYFTTSAQTSQATTGGTLATFTTTPNSVAVGFVMNVTPQISDSDVVLLNVKPTISKVLSFVNDPNPALANPCGSATFAGNCGIDPIVSPIPQIQTRELESVIKVANGDVAVMGGLIQDTVNNLENTIPGVNRVPVLGDVFANKNLQNTKTELVIFLRPVVIRDASLEGDYRGYRVFVPGDDFLSRPNPGKRPCDFRIDAGCPR